MKERSRRCRSRSARARARAGKLFGSVTAAQIAEKLAAAGLEVDRRRIDLREPIKEVGEHKVAVKLHRELVARVKVHVVAEVDAPPRRNREDESAADDVAAATTTKTTTTKNAKTVARGLTVEDRRPPTPRGVRWRGRDSRRTQRRSPDMRVGVPPHDLEAEKAVLSALLIDNNAIHSC